MNEDFVLQVQRVKEYGIVGSILFRMRRTAGLGGSSRWTSSCRGKWTFGIQEPLGGDYLYSEMDC